MAERPLERTGHDAAKGPSPDAEAARAAPARLGFARLFGLDRSGPPPPQTQAGQPLRPWTIPNAIGFLRLALIPVFLSVALSSRNGRGALPATLFAAACSVTRDELG